MRFFPAHHFDGSWSILRFDHIIAIAGQDVSQGTTDFPLVVNYENDSGGHF
jgi:hypothetical protein